MPIIVVDGEKYYFADRVATPVDGHPLYPGEHDVWYDLASMTGTCQGIAVVRSDSPKSFDSLFDDLSKVDD